MAEARTHLLLCPTDYQNVLGIELFFKELKTKRVDSKGESEEEGRNGRENVNEQCPGVAIYSVNA